MIKGKINLIFLNITDRYGQYAEMEASKTYSPAHTKREKETYIQRRIMT